MFTCYAAYLDLDSYWGLFFGYVTSNGIMSYLFITNGRYENPATITCSGPTICNTPDWHLVRVNYTGPFDFNRTPYTELLIGGSGSDEPTGIAINNQEKLFVCGKIGSSTFTINSTTVVTAAVMYLLEGSTLQTFLAC